jgi:hypothetical protein
VLENLQRSAGLTTSRHPTRFQTGIDVWRFHRRCATGRTIGQRAEYVQKYLDADPSDRSVAGHVLVREEPDEEDDEQGDGEEKDSEEDDDEGYSE